MFYFFKIFTNGFILQQNWYHFVVPFVACRFESEDPPMESYFVAA